LFRIFNSRRTQSASECALLLAIPLSRAEYDAAWRRGTDFLSAYAAACGVADPDLLWKKYEPYAELCRAAVEDAKAYGVAVRHGATLDAFADAVGRFATVTIVAHSREPEIEVHDIVAFASLRSSLPRVAAALGVTAPANGIDGPTHLAQWLDAALGPRDGDLPDGTADTSVAAWRAHHQRQRWIRRQMVEELCPGSLTGGPAVELDGRLWPLTTIDAKLPIEIRTLDLTVCDSVLLADVLRARRTGGIILANAYPTTPDFRLALYRETIRLMMRRGIPYHEAALTLRRSLRSRVSRTSRRESAG